MPDNFYIATAIDYTNSAPHIGHAYEKVLADVVARYHRLKGDNVFFLTGVDQHGQKVQQSAAKEGLAAQEFVTEITGKFQHLWDKLDIRYSDWAATTEPRHKTCVQKILQRLWEEKKIYKKKQGGYYSVRQEQFLTDKEKGPDGGFGPEWGEVEFREEENYYFKLAEHKEWLLGLLQKRPDLVSPDFRQTELRNAAEKLSGDLCISRPKSRLGWGIELPFDADFVTYVWFDALVNYISFAPGGYDPKSGAELAEFKRWWPALIVIGKDILIPAHGIYWMIMLHALGFSDDEMPPLLVHGWWNIGGAKMSKSLGNVVDPDVLVDKYGAEALRYYLMKAIASGKDAEFDERSLVSSYNSDLANNVGNLLSRSINMIYKFREGRILRKEDEMLSVLIHEAEGVVTDYKDWMDQSSLDAGLTAIDRFANRCNEMIEQTAPWKLAKNSASAEKLDAVLYALSESLRIIALLISPVLPKAAHGIFGQLNWKMELSGKEERFSLADAVWGELPDHHPVGKPTPLFPRIESDEPTD